ncbi:hypothetical protein [Emcibacter sp. SYSU 3D8]|uniref:hypothetical protein n=1 Tax=Emcibacter sp. SYSU 3D8 TaxID=3133969 RepID=UPI0031FEC35C
MIDQSLLAQRGARLLAVTHLGRAVAAWHDLEPRAVLDDAARFAGGQSLTDVPAEMLKPVMDYLCGRLLVPVPCHRQANH